MDRIEGRTALVTGAAGGIGYAIANALREAGARVVLADIDAEELRRVAEPLGANAAGFVLDVCDRAQWAEAKRFAETRFGPVEILVCNAGIGPDGRQLADMDPAGFDRIVRINLTGVFNGMSAFAADMRSRRDGHIVATASMAGLTAVATVSGYVATKFAVVGLAETLRVELAPHNVGVSVLCPGLVRTRLTQTTLAAGSARSEALKTIGGGIDPAVVGALVVDGIRANKAHIVTHGEYRDRVAARMDAILADFDGVPARGGLDHLPKQS